MVIITHTDGQRLIEHPIHFFPNLGEVLYLPEAKRANDRFVIVRISHELTSSGLITRCLVDDIA